MSKMANKKTTSYSLKSPTQSMAREGSDDTFIPFRFNTLRVDEVPAAAIGSTGDAPLVGSIQAGADNTTQSYESGQSSSKSQDAAAKKQPPKQFVRMDTIDELPSINFYSNFMQMGRSPSRPTLHELHNSPYEEDELSITTSRRNLVIDDEAAKISVEPQGPKFGWIQGVLIRCFLNIIGVMLYLRLTWVTAHAGIGLGTCVVLLSSLVTTLTTLSMCAICTNGEVRGGGAYFMISRSLGPEFGGSIGIIFSFANAVAVAMHTVGFAETVKDLIKDRNVQFLDSMEGGQNVIRVVGIGAVLVLLGITQIGMAWEAKAQNFFLVTLLISAVDYIVGTFLPPSNTQKAKGFVGYSGALFSQNFGPAFRNGEDFFTVFGVYFPAATGILAGANISGDLKNPQHDIPLGTLLAILCSSLLYGSFIWFSGSSVLRDASGRIEDYYAGTISNCAANGTCPYGLFNYMQTCEVQAAFGPLVTAGIFAATLSSALAALVSSPKLFQAVCKDKLFPYISIFGRGFGSSGEPRLGYILAFVISVLMILVGNLNVIAPIISNFFLATYGLINFATFDASFANSPGFRPSFKYYNKWASLLGAALCVAGMFVINWWTALITFAIIAAIYIYVLHRKPDVNWGSSSQAHVYRSALKSMLKLQQLEEHIKNYRPQVLCLTGRPASRPALVDFVTNITRERSLLICGEVVVTPAERRTTVDTDKLRVEVNDWLVDHKVRGFYQPVVESSIRTGVLELMANTGLSKLRPNVILFGFKMDWQVCPTIDMQNYFNMVHDAFDANLAVCILRAKEGFDVKEITEEEQMNITPPTHSNLGYSRSVPNLSSLDSTSPHTPVTTAVTFEPTQGNIDSGLADKPETRQSSGGLFSWSLYKKVRHPSSGSSKPSGTVTKRRDKAPIMDLLRRLTRREKVLAASGQFKNRIEQGRIDVWWLFDDGGLTLLLPHLLTKEKSYLENAKLRVFTIGSSAGNVDEEKRNMAALLAKFRIPVTDVQVIGDIRKEPAPGSVHEFEQLIGPYRHAEIEDDTVSEPSSLYDFEPDYISESELTRQEVKTKRQIRIRELLLQHSRDAALIVLYA